MPLDTNESSNGRQSFAHYRSDAVEPALRGENPLWQRVPLTGGTWQTALSDARRSRRIGRAKGNQNALKHGLFTKSAIEERDQVRAFIGEARTLLKDLG